MTYIIEYKEVIYAEGSLHKLILQIRVDFQKNGNETYLVKDKNATNLNKKDGKQL